LAKEDFARVVTLADHYAGILRQGYGFAHLPYVLYYKGKALLSQNSTSLDEASQVLREARAGAESIGLQPALWMILAALADVETRRGNQAEARALRAQARKVVATIAEHAGMPELRASFLNLPDVKSVMREA